ncbi:hypothetical protein ACFL6M_04540 [Candidatus Eisenbacteria bacterium]|uniref:Uncharacterized protein n=1 Tax=Eiseniibacteriota bacterium TaxID=2212470 RepID=A0ABV6YKK3_UNCEI
MSAQMPDVLLYDGERLPLLSNPLESYWDIANPRARFVSNCSGLWRGYVATYAIEADTLYFIDIEGTVAVDDTGRVLTINGQGPVDEAGRLRVAEEEDGDELAFDTYPNEDRMVAVTIDMLFPGCAGWVKASWFSGELRVGQGELIRGVSMGYQSVYERELFLAIQQGRIIDRLLVDNTST